ncbi:MAG: tRNA (adenosine(37)-N6)-threonylcarbamoyltransferase complex ATPase subunit type 1 TsaE [Melioribacteraceae bacterium]|nr:tRNA (adenosine(37)-N6)-threonylcarbamoyltransferase complex ATPase subunit type 1 TsaE [Melioribacteraceae bacterium]
MTFPVSVESLNESDTINFANEFAVILNQGDIVALKGNLGSGKTFFIKAVCKNFEIDNVTSPSFAIVNSYDGKYKINHFDFYRIKKIDELYDIGYYDYLNDSSITFIEWADLFPKLLHKNYYEINIEIDSQTTRKISIRKYE